MRCSCQRCGTYMVQREKGLSSECVCPECFLVCNACMGTAQGPMTPEGLVRTVLSREAAGDALPQEENGAGLSYESLYSD